MCEDAGGINAIISTFKRDYHNLKRWYTGITHNCDCNSWHKKHCLFYGIDPLPLCIGWKTCPQFKEKSNGSSQPIYDGIPATARFKKKFLAYANTDRGAWVVAAGCLAGIMLLDGFLMGVITGTFQFVL
jgi:hypothetical protein